MIGKYKVITLCGSTRFKDAFMEAQKRLTLEGNIVISVGLFGHSGDDEVWTEGTKEMLDDMHKRKIDMADEIFVINVGGYIGASTRSEIEYAKAAGKAVRYLEPNKKYDYYAVLYEMEDNGGAYVAFPWNIREEFGKGRVKVHALFDGIPYDGSIVNMGVKNPDGSVCYIIGVLKTIRNKLNKHDGDTIHVVIEREE